MCRNFTEDQPWKVKILGDDSFKLKAVFPLPWPWERRAVESGYAQHHVADPNLRFCYLIFITYWNLPAWNPPVTVLVSHYRSSNQSCSSEVLGHECPHFFPRRICKVAGQLWYMAIRLWWGSVARWSFDRRGHWGVRYATSSKYARLFFLVWWSVEYWFFFYLSKNKIKKSCLSPTTPQNPGGVIRVNLTSWESKLMWWVQQGPCCHFWIVLYRV